MMKSLMSVASILCLCSSQMLLAQSGSDGGATLPDANYELYKTNTVPVIGTNCSVSLPWGNPDSASWDGECEDGKLSGEGTLVWRKDDSIIWNSPVGPEWGLILEDGHLWVRYPVSDFELSVARCENADFKRDISIIADDDVDPRLFSNGWLTAYIMTSAIRNLAERCKFNGAVTYSGISASIFVGQPRDERYDWIVEWRADRYRGANPAGGTDIAADWQQNNAFRDMTREVEASNRAEAAEQRAEERRQAELRAAQQAELRRQEQERREIAAREAAERRAAEIRALKDQIDEQWSVHMDQQLSGNAIIENIGDILVFNKARAIGFLSSGVRLRLRTDNLSFQDGAVIISDTHDPTDIYRPVREAEQAAMSELGRFLVQTQQVGVDFSGPSIRVICMLDSNSLGSLEGKSTVIFDATMTSLDTRSAVFDCELD